VLISIVIKSRKVSVKVYKLEALVRHSEIHVLKVVVLFILPQHRTKDLAMAAKLQNDAPPRTLTKSSHAWQHVFLGGERLPCVRGTRLFPLT
jgi:hypothetical protein